MGSYDVVNLFTCIPTKETIKKSWRATEELLVIATQESHFMFDGLYFDQIDGQAMGAPLAPTFTEFFMINFEKKYMDIIEEYGVEVWLMFVDDIFILIV